MTTAFDGSRLVFDDLVGFLEDAATCGLEHADLEREVEARGRELMRRLTQDHFDLRCVREARLDGVAGSDGLQRTICEPRHSRGLATIFGDVTVTRLAYRRRLLANLHPADAVANLPRERHSHGLRRLAAVESSRGSFEGASEAVSRATGQDLGKRQIEELAYVSAADFDEYYATRVHEPVKSQDLLVVSADGKGIVMRPEALRAATAIAARKAGKGPAARLSKDEKHNRKRLAEVGAVYDAAPVRRKLSDILTASDEPDPTPGPLAKNKWLTASITCDTASVIGQVFDEADRRDPGHQRTWVALVDGNLHQIACIKAEAARRQVRVAIVCDFVHVLEYLWKAGKCFFKDGDPAAEAWVQIHGRAVLAGGARSVATGIRQRATRAKLTTAERAGADECATYLKNKEEYLDYRTALRQGWPIATGVIEGACRHLVKDRMDLTGARWGLAGAEAILKLRALRINGDFDDYWPFHLARERSRVHESRYRNGAIPRAA